MHMCLKTSFTAPAPLCVIYGCMFGTLGHSITDYEDICMYIYILYIYIYIFT